MRLFGKKRTPKTSPKQTNGQEQTRAADEKETQNSQQSQDDHRQSLSTNLQQNWNAFKDAFGYPANISFKQREVYVAPLQCDGVLLFLEGTVDSKSIEKNILDPLLTSSANLTQEDDLAQALLKKTLTTSTGRKISTLGDGIQDLLHGSCILLVEGLSTAISLTNSGFESRSVTTPQVENVLRGPKEAFVESSAVNRSLMRKYLKDHHLICEWVSVGEMTAKQVSVMYLNNVADPELVKRVKERIKNIKAHVIPDLSVLEEYIEDRPYSLVPSTLMTERPDRACSFLTEGHVVLLMENSPHALIVPVTFWSMFQTAEDYYFRWSYGNFVRLVRLLAVFVALLAPSIYIAVSNFHEEMIQTDLLLAIASTRERVPFPALIEVLIMEVAFELVREAGVRIPTVIGPTIGIVGALILGNAAVDANIVSPILVIIVAITGLSSFAIPEISFNFGIRIMRFVVLIAAAAMGFYGIALFLAAFLAYLVSLKSFDVPFLSPLAPYTRSSKDLLIRPPVFKMWLRPFNLSPQLKKRGKKPEGNANS
jgi:spore germination protein KA